MKVDWYKGCKSEDDKKARRDMIRAAAPTLKVLKEILQDRKKEAQDASLKKLAYENPSWPYLQADSVGTVRTLEYVLSLLDQEEI